MTDGWTLTAERLPKAFESVQVFIPTQFPFPTVREGYIFEKDNKPYAWYIPALREKYPLEDFIVAWKPMSDPPEWKQKKNPPTWAQNYQDEKPIGGFHDD